MYNIILDIDISLPKSIQRISDQYKLNLVDFFVSLSAKF